MNTTARSFISHPAGRPRVGAARFGLGTGSKDTSEPAGLISVKPEWRRQSAWYSTTSKSPLDPRRCSSRCPSIMKMKRFTIQAYHGALNKKWASPACSQKNHSNDSVSLSSRSQKKKDLETAAVLRIILSVRILSRRQCGCQIQLQTPLPPRSWAFILFFFPTIMLNTHLSISNQKSRSCTRPRQRLACR